MRFVWKRRRGRRGSPATLAGLLVALTWSAPAPAQGFGRRLAERAHARGVELEARGDIARALSSYSEAVQTDDTFGAAVLRLAALRERVGDTREAELLYGRAASLPDVRAEALAARASLRDRARRRDEAIADLTLANELSPRADRLRLLASWYVERRSWPAALATWRRLLALALESGDEAAARDARVTASALAWLAADSDPVQAGRGSNWVRRSLARLARRDASAQGARKLTP